MSLTDKQKAILQKNGYNPNDYSYEKASELIGEILMKPRSSQFVKTLPTKEVVAVEKPGFRKEYVKDVNPFYVAYAKDLAVAMINAVVQQNSVSMPELRREVNAVEIMDLAIMMVGAARQRLRE